MLKYPNSDLHLFLIPYRYRYVLLKDYIRRKINEEEKYQIKKKKWKMESKLVKQVSHTMILFVTVKDIKIYCVANKIFFHSDTAKYKIISICLINMIL